MKRELEDLISKNKLNHVFDILLTSNLKEIDKELYNKILLLSARFKRINHSKLSDTESNDNINLEYNKITESLLTYTNELPSNIKNIEIPTEKKRHSFVKWVVVILTTLGCIFYLLINYCSINKSVNSPQTNEVVIDTLSEEKRKNNDRENKSPYLIPSKEKENKIRIVPIEEKKEEKVVFIPEVILKCYRADSIVINAMPCNGSNEKTFTCHNNIKLGLNDIYIWKSNKVNIVKGSFVSGNFSYKLDNNNFVKLHEF